MTIKKFPLKVIQEYSKLHKELKSIVREYPENIGVKEETTSSITIKDVDNGSSFYFKVSNPTLKNLKVSYTIDHSPSNSSLVSGGRVFVEYNKVIDRFRQWVIYLMEYDLISYSDEEELENSYFKEQEEWFCMLDTEDENTPLELKIQLGLENYLQKSIEYAEAESDVDLVEELKNFKQKIGSLTKSQMILRLNSTLAKVRVKSFKSFKVLMRLLLSEGFSFVIQTTLTKMIQG